jgi:hypothetical protein
MVARFPRERGFVVQFCAGSVSTGSVKHADSAEYARSASPEDLLAFMARVLRGVPKNVGL